MHDHIIGMDIAKPPFDKSDFSALSVLCLNCKTIMHTELFVGKEPKNKIPIRCPSCKSKLGKCKIIKE